MKRLPVRRGARKRFLRFTTPRTPKFQTRFSRVWTRFLLIAVYFGGFAVGIYAADEDELMRTFLLLCLLNGSHAPRGDTAPKEAIYQYAQHFQQPVRCVRRPLHPRVSLQPIKSIWTFIKWNLGRLWLYLNTFLCFRAPVGAQSVELTATIILHNCNFTIFDRAFPLI